MPRAEKQRCLLHENVRRNVRLMREIMGFTQQELADRLHVARAYIADIERGRNVPSLGLIERVAQALGVRPIVLFKPPRK